MNFHFDVMAEENGKDVMDIFNYYIENSFAAYFENRLPNEFFKKLIEMIQGYPAYVIKSLKGKVIGFCFLKAHNPLPVFRETAEITCFIDPNETGKGIGKEALKLLENEGRNMGIKYILASISSLNEQSINFHKRNGFVECGKFCNIGKKKEKRFDVIWMEKEI